MVVNVSLCSHSYLCQIIKLQQLHLFQTNQVTMKANFQINLPSIPGKNIKFKIQDIKSAAFGTQKARFPDNKTQLTKKFVDSFQNFQQKKYDDQTQTQPESQLAKSYVSEIKQVNFRPFISENKKFLLPIYAQQKKQQAIKVQNSLLNASQLSGKGYSFGRSGLIPIQYVQQDQQNQQQQQQNNYDSYKLTDNYYFNTNQKQHQNEKQKKPKPSAVFKTQTRKRVYDRIYSSIVPGPGAYIRDKEKQSPNNKSGLASNKTGKGRQQKQKQGSLKDYKHLKQVITKVLVQEGTQEIQQQVERKQPKLDHMFVKDDRDRFGEQVFPIAPKLKVPGPGSYNINNSLQDKAKKLLLVQQQRKLLKEWFNN